MNIRKREEQSGSESSSVKTAPPGPPSKHGFFSGQLSDHRKKIAFGFMKACLIMAVGILAICSIYWGSYYRRLSRTKNLTAHVYIQDGVNSTFLNDNGIQPYIGQTFSEAVESLSDGKGALGWQIFRNSNVTREDALKAVHDQHLWVAVFVEKNATESLYKALSGESSDFTGNGLITGYYEQSTDYISSSTLVQPALNNIQYAFQSLASQNIYKPMIQALNSSRTVDLTSPNVLNVLTTPLTFQAVDRLPLAEPLLIAPLQVGLIYLIILSFFQFNFFMPVHMTIQHRLKPLHLIVYRILASFLGFFVLSLFFCLVSLAFQVDIGITFGRSGFLVFWMINFLAMAALGGATENVALIIFPTYPPLLGLWLLFWVICNISPAFSPFAVMSPFFKYGYAFPVYNALQCIKVVLCNTTKKDMGRNIGILIIWIVVNTVLQPFCLRFAGQTMAKKAMEENRQKTEQIKAQLLREQQAGGGEDSV